MPKINAGAVGLRAGHKHERSDFFDWRFESLIETKGIRLAWERCAHCPCAPINAQTKQPDPTCTLCGGTGWLRFIPGTPVLVKNLIGEFDALQTAILGTTGVPIYGIVTNIDAKDVPYDRIGARLEGVAQISVRHENKLSYYDRLTMLDATMAYSEAIDSDGASTTKATYPIRQVNLLRSFGTIYAEVTHFNVVNGVIVWVTPPAKGARLTLHYLLHPVYRVIEHPHASRITQIRQKTKLQTGTPTHLPVQAIVRLEMML